MRYKSKPKPTKTQVKNYLELLKPDTPKNGGEMKEIDQVKKGILMLGCAMREEEICPFCDQNIWNKGGETCPNCGAERYPTERSEG